MIKQTNMHVNPIYWWGCQFMTLVTIALSKGSWNNSELMYQKIMRIYCRCVLLGSMTDKCWITNHEEVLNTALDELGIPGEFRSVEMWYNEERIVYLNGYNVTDTVQQWTTTDGGRHFIQKDGYNPDPGLKLVKLVGERKFSYLED